MMKFVALLMNQKQPGANRKMMILTFFELHIMYIKKIRTIFFHTLPVIHCSIASYKYFKMLISEV